MNYQLSFEAEPFFWESALSEFDYVDMAAPERWEAEKLVNTLRGTNETQWAYANPGKVTKLGANGEADDNEFVFWNYLVGSAEPRTAHKEELARIVPRWRNLAKARSEIRFKVTGSASDSGVYGKNEALGLQRAEHLRAFLVRHGIAANRIEALSEGVRRPLADGPSPENLARNRRVELIAYLPTREVRSLGPGVRSIVHEFKTSYVDGNWALSLNRDENLFSERAMPFLASALVELQGPAACAMGFLQFVVDDARRGIYVAKRNGKALTLDYGRCLASCLPCKDNETATGNFSLTGIPNFVGPTVQARQIAFSDAPGVAFPLIIEDARWGAASLERTQWSTTFALILGARLKDGFVPLRHVVWSVKADRVIQNDTAYGKCQVRQLTTGHGNVANLDIAAAMARRTCRLLTRSMEVQPRKEQKVCRASTR